MTASRDGWVDVCGVDDVDEEDVIAVTCAGRRLAVYHSPEGTFHATDALCTHERAVLAAGLVMGHLIECPMHNGRFDYRTGEPKRAPARVPLATYPVRIDGGRVVVRID